MQSEGRGEGETSKESSSVEFLAKVWAKSSALEIEETSMVPPR